MFASFNLRNRETQYSINCIAPLSALAQLGDQTGGRLYGFMGCDLHQLQIKHRTFPNCALKFVGLVVSGEAGRFCRSHGRMS